MVAVCLLNCAVTEFIGVAKVSGNTQDQIMNGEMNPSINTFTIYIYLTAVLCKLTSEAKEYEH